MDVVDYTNDVADKEKRLQAITRYAKEKQQQTGIQLLWGTANLFSNRRYMNGAATNPDFQVLAHAGAQVKAALDAGCRLFDSAVGGIGGCPFAEDELVGNMDTIKLMGVLTESGFETQYRVDDLLHSAA